MKWTDGSGPALIRCKGIRKPNVIQTIKQMLAHSSQMQLWDIMLRGSLVPLGSFILFLFHFIKSMQLSLSIPGAFLRLELEIGFRQ